MSSPVGGFFPIPLAMMIPFMATQSLVMGEAFGRAFQFGKRKISAMSNEDFNKLEMEQMASEMFAAYKNIIPNLSTSMKDSKDFQVEIFAYMIDLPREMLAQLFGIGQPDNTPTASPGTIEAPKVTTQPDITQAIPDESQDFKPPIEGTSGELKKTLEFFSISIAYSWTIFISLTYDSQDCPGFGEYLLS